MGLETASFISQLDSTFPLGGDPINKGDDHIRLVKAVLKTQFPNLTAAAVNATVAEFNVLAGLLASTAELNIMNGALLSTAELNILNGVVSTTAELNRLQSYVGTINRALVSDAAGNVVVSLVTLAELNILDGLLASTAELNKLNGLLASTAELDTMDGILSTTSELNRLQSYIGTINRALVSDASGNIVVSPVTVAELNILDGLVSTTAELNRLQSYVGTASRALVSDGSGNIVVSPVTVTELNKLDGLTATTVELNRLVGVLGSIIDTQGGQTILDLIITNDLTINGELILNAGYSEDADTYTVTVGSKTLDTAAATFFTPTGNMTALAYTFVFSNPAASGRVTSFTLKLQNAGVATSITWPTSVDWVGGTAPVFTAAGVDYLTFFTHDGGTIWNGFVVGLDMK